MIGQTLSHYRILGALGAGGMGVVYLAEDERLGRQVALKILPADAVEDQQALDRFRLEARTASSLSHPGICAIHDIGLHESTPFIVMELLRGESLRERVMRGPMKIAEVLDIGIQLADALSAAHAQNIVHRDIKPANIFIGDKLRVKILDFGLAKFAREQPRGDTRAAAEVTAANSGLRYDNQLTTPGTAIGTVSYMSPEQARGEEVDARTDIFSLGVVLYEMVTGRQAFVGSTSAVVFDAILNRAPMSPVLLNRETPPRLQEAINTALEKERDLRYQHAADLEADLKRIRRDLQSGQTAIVSRANADDAWQPAAAPTAITTLTPPVTAPTTAASAAAVAVDATVTASRARVLSVAAAVVAVAIGTALWFQGGRLAAPANSAAAAGGDDEVRRARVRLEARDYRAALAEASAALTHDPGNAEATRIRADAEARLAELERLLTAATTAIAASDGVAAAGLLAKAQELAPGDARVAEVSARLRGLPEAAQPPAPRPTVPPVDRPIDRPPASASVSSSRPVSPPPAPAAVQLPASPPVETATPPSSRPVPVPVDPAPTPPEPAADRPTPVVDTPAPTSTPAPPPAPTPAPAPTEPRESDEAAIRRVIGIYERAIESKDLTLFRSVRPALSADEERRLRAGFEQVDRQEIDIRIESIALTGDTATVRLARQDVVQRGGRSQTTASSQTLRLARRGTGWIITELSR